MGNIFYYTALPEDAGVRADALLASRIPDISRSALQKLQSAGLVRVNGADAGKNYRAAPGDLFEVTLPEPAADRAQAECIALDVVYEDSDVIVVNKPQGMVVHPAPGHPDGTLVNALLHHCGESLSGIGGVMRPGIVHRIDRGTSGLIAAAKNDSAHRKLARQLENHSMSRGYLAVVRGTPKPEEGTISSTIGRHPTDRKRMAANVKSGRQAVTHYKVLERFTGYSLVSCSLETGRTHQIRVHMAMIGHPVAGDPVYGLKKDTQGLAAQCLHAAELRFIHPSTGEEITLTAPLPEYFERMLARLRAKQ